jgi:hypothetical protein
MYPSLPDDSGIYLPFALTDPSIDMESPSVVLKILIQRILLSIWWAGLEAPLVGYYIA